MVQVKIYNFVFITGFQDLSELVVTQHSLAQRDERLNMSHGNIPEDFLDFDLALSISFYLTMSGIAYLCVFLKVGGTMLCPVNWHGMHLRPWQHARL